MEKEISNKSRLAVVLFTAFLGPLGIHRFYLGKIGTGIIMLLLTIFFPFILPGIVVVVWTVIDLITVVSGLMKDKEGKIIKNWS